MSLSATGHHQTATSGGAATQASGTDGAVAFGSSTTGAAFAGVGGASTTTAQSSGLGGASVTGGATTTGAPATCGPADPQLGACYGLFPGAAGEGGAGGRAPAPTVDECWSEETYEDCDAVYTGQVLRADFDDATNSCDATLFDRATVAPGRRFIVWLGGELDMFLSIGALERGLDLGHLDEVEVRIQKRTYHDDFMHGTRLTVTKQGQLVAVLNRGLPIAMPTSFGELQLDRGPEVCRLPTDSFTCTYVWHRLDVWLDDEGVSLDPYMRLGLGPYEVVVDENQHVRDGGACDDGDTSSFGIFRLRAAE